MAKKYYSSLQVGDMIAPLVKPAITRVQMAKFAAATRDYNPLYVDDEYAKSEGYGGALVNGLMPYGFVEEALHNFADNMRIVNMSCTFHKLVWPGDILSAKALVTNRHKDNHEPKVDFEVWVENQSQDVVLKGIATVLLHENAAAETKAKGKLPTISEASKKELHHAIKEKLQNSKALDEPMAQVIALNEAPHKKVKAAPAKKTKAPASKKKKTNSIEE